ncbi:MAG: energy transducer TonB [Desulfomonile sp.]|nr:energy transducer TonB [Desulfomonile sp.]
MRRLSPFVCVSAAIHVCALFAFAWIVPPETGMVGSSDGDPDRVFVTVRSEEDFTPVVENPGAIDSPESSHAVKEEIKEIEPEERPDLLTREAPDGPVLAGEPSREAVPEVTPEVHEPEKKQLKEQEVSQTSLPQTASNPLMRRTALGRELHDFQSRVLAAIRQSTFFPLEAARARRFGQVTVAFTINRDGTLSAVRVVASSGCPELDDAAQEILRRASKIFPSFPAGSREEGLAYTVPIHFREKRSSGSSNATVPARPGHQGT